MECDQQVIVALTVDAGQINGTETVVAELRDETADEERELEQPISVSLSKTPVVV